MQEQKIEFYKGPAGGWGALRSVTNALLRAGHRRSRARRRCCRPTSPTASTAPAAPGPTASTPRPSSSARTASRRSPGRPPRSAPTPELLRHAHRDRAARAERLLARGPGPPDPPDGLRRGQRPLPADRAGTTPSRGSRAHLQRAARPEPGRVLHLGPRLATRRPSSTSCSCATTAPTTSPTARTCATRPAASACAAAIGVGKGTVTLEDFEQADAIFVFGQNPGTNHPRMLGDAARGSQARRARSCASTRCASAAWSASPTRRTRSRWRRSARRRSAAHYFQLRVGGDMAALKGMMKLVLARDAEAGRGEPACSTTPSSPSTPTGFEACWRPT